MAFKSALLGLAAAQVVTAHFGFIYPPWRFDTLSEEGELKYSQWDYPCAGVPYKTGNITDWPLDGGSLKLDLHHPWTYVYINLGLGDNTTNFNVSLTPEFLNVTGKGTFCIDKLPVPLNITDGTLGSLQVVTSGASGSALYNCADIRFSKDAKTLDNCTSSDGIVVQEIKQQNGNGTDSSKDGSSGSGSGNSTSGSGNGGKNGAGYLSADKVALTSMLGLATVFALGLGI
ncbi:hypothetical protein PT974_06006 [Cladobotryum mycophilum]|uniref:Copper acquisition factor BIM1-like domain-containing protein n=1 Tax=Cladobotryum mycophilum TaxID=491253 RepID=A0ABR0SKB1_9HYPO